MVLNRAKPKNIDRLNAACKKPKAAKPQICNQGTNRQFFFWLF